MSGTFTYNITGSSFEGGGTLNGTITVTYNGDAATSTIDNVDLTTIGGAAAGFHYIWNTPAAGSDDLAISQFTAFSPSPYEVLLIGTDGNHVLDLAWSGTSPTTLEPTSFEVTDGTTTRLISGTNGSSTGLMEIACFAAGTRLLTDHGEVPVEALGVGDRLPTLVGRRLASVKWIGTRTLDAARHPRPWDVAPVRVHADAFGPGQPARDLLLSPDHGVLVDDVLIPVRYLLNGATITQETAGVVTYFHVELDTHDAVFAEGLPSETYLDTGNRAAFENVEGATMMTPAFARAAWAAGGCAPLLTDGPVVLAIRQRLLDRAEALGHARTTDASLVVLADGAPVAGDTEGRQWRFDLPAGTRQVRILSRHAVPAETHAASTDCRRLGVALGDLTLDGQTAADAAHLGGWLPAEAGWRWTDGDATLDVAGARTLAFAVVLTPAYWVSDRDQTVRLAA